MQNTPLNDEALEHLVNNLNFLKDVLSQGITRIFKSLRTKVH